eukprot:SAG11_NODE_2146_length_3752_cov_8.634373_3_plen_149_part_00
MDPGRLGHAEPEGLIGGWGWSADTAGLLLWLSFTLAAAALSLGFVLLEANVAVYRINREGRGASRGGGGGGVGGGASGSRQPELRRALGLLEISVFLQRLPELLARVLQISIMAVIFPGWFVGRAFATHRIATLRPMPRHATTMCISA